jgi:translation initiation factor IF-3
VTGEFLLAGFVVPGEAARISIVRADNQGDIDSIRPRGRGPYRDPRRELPMINDRIRFPQVRVVDEKNNQLGVLETRAALDLARDRDLDLILVAAQAQPPVCRIMDYGKFKYEKSKRDKEKKGKSAANELKTVRLHPRTGEHDRVIVQRHSERFLRDGHKVRVVCQFKGRENAYPELGKAQLDHVAKALEEIAIVEGQILKQGREMAMMLSPKAGLKPLPKNAEEKVLQDQAEFERVQQALAAEAGVAAEVASEDIADDATAVDGVEDEVPTEEVGGETESDAEAPIAESLEDGENDVAPQAQPT